MVVLNILSKLVACRQWIGWTCSLAVLFYLCGIKRPNACAYSTFLLRARAVWWTIWSTMPMTVKTPPMMAQADVRKW
jgi:hypothetical protein